MWIIWIVRYLVLFDHELFNKFCDKMEKMVLQIVSIIIFERSKLIHIILYLLKKYSCFYVLILIKSVINKNKNNYYYNIFLEKGSYKDKSNAKYF